MPDIVFKSHRTHSKARRQSNLQLLTQVIHRQWSAAKMFLVYAVEVFELEIQSAETVEFCEVRHHKLEGSRLATIPPQPSRGPRSTMAVCFNMYFDHTCPSGNSPACEADQICSGKLWLFVTFSNPQIEFHILNIICNGRPM